jgi:L,D-transpeptidase catalytic domain
VNWATQISYSGIYVHSAPWSVGSQGYTNTSHGCLNVSPSNAVWFYDNTKRGDIVEVLNTLRSSCQERTALVTGTSRGSNGKRAMPTI